MTPEEQKAADAAKQKQAAADQKAAEKKAADDKAKADKIAADKKAADDKAAAQKKAAEDKAAADQKAIDDKAKADQAAIDKAEAEQKAADDQQAKISKKVEAKRAKELADSLQSAPFTGTLPTVGRIVHFYPSDSDKQALDGDVEFVAAIIVKAWGHQQCNLRIFHATEEGERWTLRKDIPHKSKAHALIAGGAYWEWPPRA